MKRLWMADVHANLPALESVLAAAGVVDEVVFLGDAVGYGPHPAECVDRLRTLAPRAVIGNHDRAVLARDAAGPSEPPGRVWDRWTARRLNARHRAYLEALPESFTLEMDGEPVRVIHHPAGAPYLHPDVPDALLDPFFRSFPERGVVCGHSHRPMDRRLGGRRVIGLPAVGQPRNGTPKAGYALERDGHLQFLAIDYDVERTVSDMLAIGLDPGFSRRWARFLRTGHDHEWSRTSSLRGNAL